MNDMQKQQLVRRAVAARSGAYAPYSGFRVGAAVLDECGKIYTGCNIENISYPATICAERAAVAVAVSAGAKHIMAVAVCAGETPVTPCGVCRQVLCEFALPDASVLCANGDGTKVEQYTLGELLPHAFAEFEKDR
ncbi:MAG: cytidine deaminase [Acetanaerobacterium sp.]